MTSISVGSISIASTPGASASVPSNSVPVASASMESPPCTSTSHATCRKLISMKRKTTEAKGFVKPKTVPRKSAQQKGKKVRGDLPVYICSVCKNVCKEPEQIKDPKEYSVGCDSCSLWYHWDCQNITASPVGDWFCPLCINDQ